MLNANDPKIPLLYGRLEVNYRCKLFHKIAYTPQLIAPPLSRSVMNETFLWDFHRRRWRRRNQLEDYGPLHCSGPGVIKLFTSEINQCSFREYLGGKYHCTVDLLFDWFGFVCFANKNKNCQLSYNRFQEVDGTMLLPPLVFPGSL